MGFHPRQTSTGRFREERTTNLPSPPAHGGSQGVEGRTCHHESTAYWGQARGRHRHHNSFSQP
eukprot:7341784-Pyramimonas_sp.AAC.2